MANNYGKTKLKGIFYSVVTGRNITSYDFYVIDYMCKKPVI